MAFPWPWARKTTYVANTPPKVAAADLDDMQDEITKINRMLRGSDITVEDDFLGQAINTGKWKTTGSPAPTDDHVSGGSGAAILATTAGTPTVALKTQALVIGTDDFYVGMRIRPATISASGTQVFGLNDQSGSGFNTYFYAHSGSHTWRIVRQDNSDTDTLIAANNQYYLLEARRTNGVLEMQIDSMQVYQGADATNRTNIEFWAWVNRAANDQDFLLDVVKLTVYR